jgi:hypothetical protein
MCHARHHTKPNELRRMHGRTQHTSSGCRGRQKHHRPQRPPLLYPGGGVPGRPLGRSPVYSSCAWAASRAASWTSMRRSSTSTCCQGRPICQAASSLLEFPNAVDAVTSRHPWFSVSRPGFSQLAGQDRTGQDSLFHCDLAMVDDGNGTVKLVREQLGECGRHHAVCTRVGGWSVV